MAKRSCLRNDGTPEGDTPRQRAISIHSLRVEGDGLYGEAKEATSISIHSLRVEGDATSDGAMFNSAHFNPLPPCGGRPRYCAKTKSQIHFNPLPPCGGRLSEIADRVKLTLISIHSLRVEGDLAADLPHAHGSQFQSTPSVWRETAFESIRKQEQVFQSTPSVWRETSAQSRFAQHLRFQSTPSVWRETYPVTVKVNKANISIHSLRVEGDALV